MKIFTSYTSGLDADTAIELYRSFFESVSQSAVELRFSMLQWDDGEAEQLAAVLPSFMRLEALDLSGNGIGDAGVGFLAEAIAKEGVCPSLTSINLNGNPASDEAKKAVVEALEKKRG